MYIRVLLQATLTVYQRRRVTSVVEHSSSNLKVPWFDSGTDLLLRSWIMMRHVSCILLLEGSTTSQRLWVYRISVHYAQKDPRFLFKKRRGQPWEFWSLIPTIDGSNYPRTVWKNSYAEHNVTGKTYMTSQGERVLRGMGIKYSRTNI